MTSFVLLHSPLLGPGSWDGVATALRAAGHAVRVPDVRSVVTSDDPASTMTDLVALAPDEVLVAHSNAGLYVPLLTSGNATRTVLVDAAVPAGGPTTPLAPPRLLAHLVDLADDDGLLPPWSLWWTPEQLAEVLPDAAQREALQAEEPRVPLAYLQREIAVPDAAGTATAYLRLSAAYDDELATAREKGWPTEVLDAGHLHHVVAPDAVAAAVLRLLERLDHLEQADHPAG